MKKFVVPYLIALTVLSFGLFSTSAFAAACSNDSGILGFPAWFHGLNCTTTSNIESVEVKSMDDIWIVVTNLVQWIIIAAGYVTIYFIIWGGFKFITAQGEPDRIKSARDTIVNAVIGLVITLAAVAIIRTIQAAIISGVAK